MPGLVPGIHVFLSNAIHPSRRIAEPFIGRAFARPGGDAPQDEVSDPHGEERAFARLEPRGHRGSCNDSSEPENALKVPKTWMAGTGPAMTAITFEPLHPNLCLASFAPAPSAISLASAMSRRIGAIPQLVVATMLLFGTNFETASITLTTSSAVSTVSLATSITPAWTILPGSSASRSSGTFELRHSIATCWIGLFAIAGKISSYCRHSLPSVCFQSVLALMP